MDPDEDPGPAIFVIDLQDTNKKLNKKKDFSAYYFLKVHLHHFSQIKSPKEVAKQ
jgi:Zn-finger domain-containing protein